jgi:fructose/tagatose bisphosphate aldolase
MPVADYQTYCRMIDRAREHHFAYPGINVTSLTTANATLRGLAEARSDGIIQITTGGAAFASLCDRQGLSQVRLQNVSIGCQSRERYLKRHKSNSFG